jgi:hypothetical protein
MLDAGLFKCSITRLSLIKNSDLRHVGGLLVMVFNATFNNISILWCRSVLLVEETGVSGENHRHAAGHCF